ncbi:ABC-F family ATP-binding cassette domain-containing protein [Bacteroidales bacterium OttesenSCG-928-L03]|nr:ABC-F family ATP-binding cassette domain-containing protein [Bacteroidales bacterium OttesenSCG-928-L03]
MTPYLQVENLTKSFGDNVLFENISLGVAQGQKIGLIAKNGTGKTTLLNILVDREDYDEGKITYRRDLKVGYLDQNPQFAPGLTVLQACNGSSDAIKKKQILSKLKITDFDQRVEELSGGQLKRVALANVLITEPDFLILDEPTNHLDLEMTEWLEGFLSRSHMTLLMVTHDRYFLDRVCTEILELERRAIYSYKGSYSYYLEKRQERIDAQNAELERSQQLFKKELEWMRRQPQARGTKAKSRVDAFYEVEKKAKQELIKDAIQLNVKSSYIGSKIFEVNYINKSYGDLIITKDFYYNFARYEKLGIVGNNGTGKSTFIKMLMGEVKPDSGSFDIGQTVNFGYFSQDGLQFDERMRVIDAVQDIAEVIDLGGGKKLTASQFLTHFLFPPARQQDFIHKLSGGEKRKLYLCQILIKNPNFLVLDEPTNDLDIVTLNILEDYLIHFKGCVIVISHDRYFMDKVVDHLLVFKGNGLIKDFPGNYTQYREAEKNTTELQETKTEADKPKPEPARKREPDKNKLSFNEKRELEQLDEEVPRLEQEQKDLEAALSSGTLSAEELLEKSNRISQILEELDEKTMRWLELSEKEC